MWQGVTAALLALPQALLAWWGVTAALVALLPGVLAWWWGRALLRRGDDAALPERLQEYGNRVGQVASAVAVILLVLGAGLAPWAIGVMVAGLLVARFPVRRALYGETWGLGAYLSHTVRFGLAFGGFWLLLLLAPDLVPAEGAARWPVMIGLVALLVAWEVAHGPILLRLTRATVLDRADLTPRFAAILAQARAAPPRLYRMGTAGGRWVNALALPAFRTPAVAFSDTLLELLSPAEIAAIFAHEVAHLEDYDRRRILRLSLVNWLAIGLGVAGVPLLKARFPAEATLIGWGWLVVVFVALALRAATHKPHETRSDRRAAELCGDPDAVGRALVALHRLARLPRRWSIEMEQAASHPSLAHRLHAIGAGASAAGPGVALPAVLASRKAGVFLILDADRLDRLEGVAVGTALEPAALRSRAARVHSTSYTELTDLRVRARLSGSTALVATPRAGQPWSVPLRPEDVAPVQSALDLLDGQVARGPTGAWDHPALTTLLMLVSLGLGYASWDLVTLVTCTVLLVRRGPASLAAFGATTAAGALLAILGGGERWSATPLGVVSLAATVLVGGLALALAVAQVRRGQRSRAGVLAAGLGLGVVALPAALPLLWTAASGGGVLSLHQAAIGASTATVALLGLAAVLATRPGNAARAAAAATAVLAILPVGLGSRWFVERFGQDPLLAAAPRLEETPGSLRLLSRTTLGGWAKGLDLSPSGLRYTVSRTLLPGSRVATARVGAFSGGQREVEGSAVRFVSDDRLLALAGSDGRGELRMMSSDDPRVPVWRRPLPALDASLLEVDRAAGAWQAAGPDSASGELVMVAGTSHGDDVAETRLRLPGHLDPENLDYVTSPGAALALDMRGEVHPLLERLGRGRVSWLLQSVVFPVSRHRSNIWLLTPRGSRHLLTSELPVQCLGLPRVDTGFVCLAWDEARTRLWRVDPVSGDRRCIGWIPGFITGPVLAGRDLAGLIGTEVVLVDLSAGRVRRLPLPAGTDRPYEIAFAADRLAALSPRADGSHVTLYAIE